jgi:WD40 repeat protein
MRISSAVDIASHDGTARIWAVVPGRDFLVLRGHESSVDFDMFDPVFTQIITTSLDSTLRFWDSSGRSIRG